MQASYVFRSSGPFSVLDVEAIIVADFKWDPYHESLELSISRSVRSVQQLQVVGITTFGAKSSRKSNCPCEGCL